MRDDVETVVEFSGERRRLPVLLDVYPIDPVWDMSIREVSEMKGLAKGNDDTDAAHCEPNGRYN